MCTKKLVVYILLIIMISNFIMMLMINEVQAFTYNQVKIKANSSNNNGISAFPESYQIMLNKLVKDTGHTNWKFEPFYTDIPWSELTSPENENKCLRNTIHKSNGSSWICNCGRKGDVGYYCAKATVVNYYLDPRNFLTETTIFQFLDLANTTVVPVQQIERAVKGTYLAGSVNGMSYAQMIYDASTASGENALSLVVKIFQELGNGTELPYMISGKDSTYPNTYNFFNYGSTDGEGNLQRGLAKASELGWNSPYTALVEGAKLLTKEYISAGQNTKYLFKFDVVADDKTGLYWHQYMTNLQDPTNQSKMLFDKYNNYGWLNQELTFTIPVYKDMPAYIKKPTSLNTSSGQLYFVSSSYRSVNFRNAPNTSSTVLGTLSKDTVVVMVEENAGNSNGINWSKIRLADGREVYFSRGYLTKVNTKKDIYYVPSQTEPGKPFEQPNKFKIEGTSIITTPNIKLSDIKEKNNVSSAKKGNNNISDGELLGTGNIIVIDGKTYTVVKMGDIDGDGIVHAVDYVLIKNNIMGISILNDVQRKAADLDCDSTVHAVDYVHVKNYIMNIQSITI